MESPSANITTGIGYTEQILYADGNRPRYDGTASAHVSSLGGRYDFTFDNHDRLTVAAYSSAKRGQDFSTQYTYNALGAPVSLNRKGINNYAVLGSETFGMLDELTYSWDGARLLQVTATANGTDFYGRTGFQLSATGGTADFEFNAAGMLTADSSRGITAIEYNRMGLPTKVTFTDGSYTNYLYTYGGELTSVKTYGATTRPIATLKSTREYCGAFIFEDGALSMANFPGGYFDGDNQPFYRHTDWQGNVTMVTNAAGKVAQHVGYYPYGEPWREPSGQPYLFGGKERMREGALNEYDFGARRYNPALALWTTPDPVVHDQYSPYTYCAGNPIRYIDPNGMEFTDGSMPYINALIDDINNRWSVLNYEIANLNKLLLSGLLNSEDKSKIEDQIFQKHKQRNELLATKQEIQLLKESTQLYNVSLGGIESDNSDTLLGESTYDYNKDIFNISLQEFSIGLLAHELKHAYQFEMGEFSFSVHRNGTPFYDQTDEIEAYKRGALFGIPFNGDLSPLYNELLVNKNNVEIYLQIKGGNINCLKSLADNSYSIFRWKGITYKSNKYPQK